MNARELQQMSRPELREVMRAGYDIDARALDEREYHGVSLGLPSVVEKLRWKTFIKTFHPDADALPGWNVRVDQRAPFDYTPMLERGAPKTFGFYDVRPLAGYTCDLNHGLMIDYGQRENPLTMRRLRDPIVAVRKGDVSLLLGYSYVDLGSRAFSTPSFFTLERGGKLAHVPARAHP